MNCHICTGPGIENSALGKTFHYCRNCKIEIEAPKPFDEPVYFDGKLSFIFNGQSVLIENLKSYNFSGVVLTSNDSSPISCPMELGVE